MLIGVNMDRARLYERIDLRVDQMMQHGLLEEARKIYDAGHDPNLPAMRSIGYAQLFSYFSDKCTLEQAVEKIKLDTRHFAKRQLSWFRRDARICWHDVANWDSVKNDLIQQLTQQSQDWMRG